MPKIVYKKTILTKEHLAYVMKNKILCKLYKFFKPHPFLLKFPIFAPLNKQS